MKKFMRVLIGLIGAALGALVVFILFNFDVVQKPTGALTLGSYLAGAVLGFLVLFLLSRFVIEGLRGSFDRLTVSIRRVPLSHIILRTVGLIVGLFIASIVSNPVLQLSISRLGNVIGVIIAVIIYALLGLLGMRVATLYHDDILSMVAQLKGSLAKTDRTEKGEPKEEKKKLLDRKKKGTDVSTIPKILDTSVIIDGRIFEVIKTGFLEGPFVVSHYVLEELQHISDSADTLRRERGRKGLDAVHALQNEASVMTTIDNTVIDRAKEVDAKLLILTQELHGRLVTNDFNLNKVAMVQGVAVLNVNDLANAVKPVVIPGEHMIVPILKPGKEIGQGLGYLDDGTMIVVENGGNAIGKTVDTIVTSVLQTSAGKMIFTRIQEEEASTY